MPLCHPGRTGQSWDLNLELSDPRDRFSMCLCRRWWWGLLGRIQHAGEQRDDPQDMAFVLLTPD